MVALILMDMVALVMRVLIVMDLRLNISVVALVMRVLIDMDLRLNTSTEVVDMENKVELVLIKLRLCPGRSDQLIQGQ